MSLRTFLILATCGAVCTVGCGTESSRQPPLSNMQSVPPPNDPVAELRAIIEAGKKRIPKDDKWTLVHVDLDVIKTSSLVVPYVGQILAEWDKGPDESKTQLTIVYYKYESNRWVPTFFNRAPSGGKFPGLLTEGKALMTEYKVPPEWTYPLSGPAHFTFTVFDPNSQ